MHSRLSRAALFMLQSYGGMCHKKGTGIQIPRCYWSIHKKIVKIPEFYEKIVKSCLMFISFMV